jgi:hypothetical protein
VCICELSLVLPRYPAIARTHRHPDRGADFIPAHLTRRNLKRGAVCRQFRISPER